MSTIGDLSAESLLNNLEERFGNRRLQVGLPGGVLLTMNTCMASGISENLNVMTGAPAPQREALFILHILGSCASVPALAGHRVLKRELGHI